MGDDSVIRPIMSHMVRPSHGCSGLPPMAVPPASRPLLPSSCPLSGAAAGGAPSSWAGQAPGAGQSDCNSAPDIMPAPKTLNG